MSYQVYAKDQYGRHEIVTALSRKGIPENEWKTADEALAAAKRWVHDKNRNNPLTFDEQKRSVSTVVFEPAGGAIYAGNLIHGKHKTLVKTASDGNPVESELSDGATGLFYIGNMPDNTPWYLTNPRGALVSKLGEYQLEDKTLVFVRPVK